MTVKIWSVGLAAVLSAVIVAIAAPAVFAGDNGLLAGYENGDREFKKFEIGDMTIYFHQRMIDEAIVEKDFIVYQFDRKSKELLEKGMHWRSGLPEHVTPAITQEEAERMVKGEIQFTRLYIISPESDVFPLKPTPDNPCWVVRSLDDDRFVVTIVDAVEGRVLGNGVPPPYTGFSYSGPWEFSPCSGTWTSWYQNAEYWFDTMGYSTEAVEWPYESKVRGHVQSCSTAMFYELAHGGSSYFKSGCYDWTYAYQVQDWIENYAKMPFTFIGSCGGMCYVGSSSFSYEFRKGSMESAVTVGYCNMAEPWCSEAWGNSVEWQDAMFDYMNQGYTVKDAFDQAIADYPMCFDCMRFCGDEDFPVVPVVKRNREPVLSDGYVIPETGTTDTMFTYCVNYYDADGNVPSVSHVYMDGDPYEMYVEPPGDSLYLYETTLSAGVHDYYFYFENVCGMCRLPDTGVFIGPDLRPQFIRADANADMLVEMSDATYILRWLYVPGTPDPLCLDAADVDDDSEIEMSDAVFTLKYLYVPESPEPPAPGPETCGPDPTPDDLECEEHPCM